MAQIFKKQPNLVTLWKSVARFGKIKNGGF